MSSFRDAEKQFAENQRLFGNVKTQPDNFNLYAGLSNLASGLEALYGVPSESWAAIAQWLTLGFLLASLGFACPRGAGSAFRLSREVSAIRGELAEIKRKL